MLYIIYIKRVIRDRTFANDVTVKIATKNNVTSIVCLVGYDNHDGDHPETSNTSPPVPPPTQQIPQTVSSIKLSILKKREYDSWAMKMKHYLSHTDYSIWQVIQNGNGHVSVTTNTNGMIKVLPLKTAKEVVAREKERKERTTLLMALLEDHLAKFHKMDDAKEMWEAIKSRFGGNDESKNMQKYLLKQQFEGFSMSTSEGLHKGYDKFQTLLSQLEIHGAGPGLDTLSFNDLYNNLRVFERDIKGTTASSSNIHNVAFVSTDNTSSTNDVSTAYSVSSPSISKLQKEGSSLAKGNQDNRRRGVGYNGNKTTDNVRRPAYQDDSKALVTIDGEDIDWSRYVEEDAQNYAMMAYPSNNPGSDNKHKKLLAEALKENKDLKTKFENWQNSSKNLSILLNTQMSANDKFRLGYGDYRYGSILSYKNEVLQSVFMNKVSDLEDTSVNDRYVDGMHAVPPPITGNYMPSRPDVEIDYFKFTYGPMQTLVDESDSKPSEYASCESDSSVETTTSMLEPEENAPKVVCKPKVWTDAPIIEEENVKETGTPNHIPKIEKQDRNGHTRKGLGYAFTRKACFVCGSFSHLIRDCDFHEKRMAKQAELTKSKNKDDPHRALKDKVIINSECYRHMTGNKAYLADYQEFKGSSVSFGGSNGRITGEDKFWKTATFKTVNNISQIHVKVAGKPVVITEASIRSDLLFNDVDGIDCLTNEAIFENLALIEYEGDLTRLTVGEGEDLGTPIESQPTPSPTQPSAGDQPPLTESSLDHDSSQDPSMNLEGIGGSGGDQVHLPYDSPLSGGHTFDRAEGSLNLEALYALCTNLSNMVLALETIKDAQAKEIFKLKAKIKKLERRCKPSSSHHQAWLRNMEYMDTEEALNEGRQSTFSTARPDDHTTRPDVSTARQELSDDEEMTLADTLIKLKDDKAKELERERQREEQASMDCIANLYDEVQARIDVDHEFTHSQLNKKSFEEIQGLYIKEQELIADFVPIGSKKDERMIRDLNKKIEEESSDKGIDSTKKRKEGSRMVTRFDRLDLVELYNLVMQRFKSTTPEGVDLILWGDLGIMFKENAEDIHMFAERRYPLTTRTLERMLPLRLIVESASDAAYDLLRFIQKQIDESRGHDRGKRIFKCWS
nr:ribonuclease H-like domain-containing protein [Tanacetum cinerariifolium]